MSLWASKHTVFDVTEEVDTYIETEIKDLDSTDMHLEKHKTFNMTANSINGHKMTPQVKIWCIKVLAST